MKRNETGKTAFDHIFQTVRMELKYRGSGVFLTNFKVSGNVKHCLVLRHIPLKVRAISAKIIYLKSTHSTLTFLILF